MPADLLLPEVLVKLQLSTELLQLLLDSEALLEMALLFLMMPW